MASVLKVDKLDPQSGTALEIGTSGDTITVPSGATLDISASTLTPPATMPASSGVNLTALNATNLGSGTVPTARLGTGTASSSTVLYGDQTYKAEPGGGKINQITRTFSTTGNSAIATTSTTFEDSGLSVTITPSATNSVIIVDFACAMSVIVSNRTGEASLYRSIGAGADTEITTAAYKWGYVMLDYGSTENRSNWYPSFMRFIDTTHNTTSACEYKIYFKNSSASYTYTLVHSNTTYSMIATEVLA
jgi:hypothetical protein